MTLDSLGGYSQGYNAYNIPSAKDVQNIGTSKAPSQIADQPQEKQIGKEEKPTLDLTVEVDSRANASIENVAISFGQYDSSSIDLFGDSDLASKDMKKAISGMQRDQILQEYQYFVGNKVITGNIGKVISGSEDGVVLKLK